MEIQNFLKVITAFITVIFAFVAGYIELKKNPKYWLNRWFATFFVSLSFGFLFYTIYHLMTADPTLIIPFMITAQMLYNFAIISLLMTVFILEYSEKIAMSKKYLSIALILWVLSFFGYFIWVPTINMENYAQGVVDTETPAFWAIYVNIWRVAIAAFVLYKFAKIAMNTEGKSKQRVLWFLWGSVVVVIAMFLNTIGGLLSSLWIEIFSLIGFDIGIVMIVKGFLIK